MLASLDPRPQAQEQLAVRQDEARELQDAVKAGRERAEAADLSTVALKAQLAEAKKEADARERALQVGGGQGQWGLKAASSCSMRGRLGWEGHSSYSVP